MNDQPNGCTSFALGVVIIMALIGMLAVAGMAPGGNGGTTDSGNTTHVLSDNEMRIFSPDTNIYVNSQNPQVDARTMTGDNRIDMGAGIIGCWDDANQLYRPGACQ